MVTYRLFLGCVCILLAFEIILAYPNDVATAFKCSKLVPDVTPCAPHCELQVGYPHGNFVYLGKVYSPAEIVEAPAIEFLADASTYYTLAMVDADPHSQVPNDTTRSEFRHWLVGNMPGDEVYAGETLAEYINPTPPPGSGVHRYAFLVYKQEGYIKFKEPKLNATVKQQRYTLLYDFVDKYNLGCPVFGNFYRTAAEEPQK